MTKEPTDGGPAFPRHTDRDEVAVEGMTLRDYFATHSPLTFADAERSLKDEGAGFVNYGSIFKRLCQMQLAYADALLEERKAK